MKIPHQIVGRTRPSSQGLGYFSAAGATPEAFGAGVGAALVGLGGTIAAEDERRAAELKQREDKTARFSALTNFSDFELEVAENLEELKRNADPTGKGFVASAEALYQKKAEEFLTNKVDPELQEEFRFRASQTRQRIIGESLTFQYKAGDVYYRTNLDKEYQRALKGLDPATGGDPAQLEAFRASLFEKIDATDLAEVEKVQLKREMAGGLESVSYKQKVKEQLSTGSVVQGDGLDIIRKEEGFIPTPRFDVNAQRVGYGSDTITHADGSYERVRKGMRITREDAERDLRRRAKEFADEAAKAVGPDIWSGLSDNVRAALTSVAYNYGSLGSGGANIVGAVRTGDPEIIAKAVEGLSANKSRRKREAALIRGQAVNYKDDIDDNPAYTNVPYETRLALREDAARELAAEATAERTARTNQINTQFNDLMNGLADGKYGRADIDNAYDDGEGWLTDFDQRKKALDFLAKRDEDANFLALAHSRLEAGDTFTGTTEDNKALNALANEGGGIGKLKAGDQSYFTGTVLPRVTRAGDIPTDEAATLSAMIRSDNQQQARFALEALRQLREAEPGAFDLRISDAVRDDLDYWEQRQGMYPDDVTLGMIRGQDTATRKARDVLEKEAQNILSSTTEGMATVQKMVADFVSGMGAELGVFGPTAHLVALPIYARDMSRDYQIAFTDNYVKFQDKELAKQAGEKTLAKYWGPTGVGDPGTVMKYRPEMAYAPVAGDHSYIDRQVRARFGLKDDQKFQLLSDDQTEREYQKYASNPKADPPSYGVVQFDAFGTPFLDPKSPRMRFEITPQDRLEEQKTFQKKVSDYDKREIERIMEGAKLLELQGVPIPKELQQDYDRIMEQDKKINPPVPENLELPADRVPWAEPIM